MPLQPYTAKSRMVGLPITIGRADGDIEELKAKTLRAYLDKDVPLEQLYRRQLEAHVSYRAAIQAQLDDIRYHYCEVCGTEFVDVGGLGHIDRRCPNAVCSVSPLTHKGSDHGEG
jgi:hypothetical protein